MSAPLTNSQKAYLAQLSRRAWQASPDADAQDEATYRHTQVSMAVGLPGLRLCSQDDYAGVKAHFENLLGFPDKALRHLIYGGENDKRIWLYKLSKACLEFGLDLSYAEAICRRQNRGLSLADVPWQTVRFIFFTIRNRGKQKQSQAA